jgi:chromosomal replication initiation ATPase DnaA
MGTFQDPAIFLSAQRAGLAQTIVGQIYAVSALEMRGATRGRPRAAWARQVAIHLAHSVFGMSHVQLAVEFQRDRSTVSHACDVIRRQRANNSELDATLHWMEAHLRRVTGSLS